MPKTSIYLPQDLADQAKALDLNVSAVLQEALRAAIEQRTGRCSRCGGPIQLRLGESS